MYGSLAPDLNSTFTESQVLRVTMGQGERLRSSEGELGPQPVDAWKFFPMLTHPPRLSQSSSPSRLLSASHVPLSGSLAPLPRSPTPHVLLYTHVPTHPHTQSGCFCHEKNVSVLGLASCLHPLLLRASQPGIPREGPWP